MLYSARIRIVFVLAIGAVSLLTMIMVARTKVFAGPQDGLPQASERARILSRLVKAAEKRVAIIESRQETGGQVSIDGYIAASRELAQALSRDAKPADVLAARRSHRERMARLADREKARLSVGRATPLSVAETEFALAEAELWLLDLQTSTPGK